MNIFIQQKLEQIYLGQARSSSLLRQVRVTIFRYAFFKIFKRHAEGMSQHAPPLDSLGSILFLLYPFVFSCSTRWHKITKQNESNVIVGFILHCKYCPISNQCFCYYKYLLSTLLQVRMKEWHLISMCCGHVVFLFYLIVTCEFGCHTCTHIVPRKTQVTSL